MCKLLPALSSLDDGELHEESVRKAIDFSESCLNQIMTKFNHELIGHLNFKKRLGNALRKFITLNKLHVQNILSIFLFGASGIGKTEVARLLAKCFRCDARLAKISFQNYSSQDALNSLIGSPAGYIGCEHGELGDKIKKSNVGILLCDEFEKTTRPVFSFFSNCLKKENLQIRWQENTI